MTDTDTAQPVNISIPPKLLARLDKAIEAGSYNSRSEAVRAALRAWLPGEGVGRSYTVRLYDNEYTFKISASNVGEDEPGPEIRFPGPPKIIHAKARDSGVIDISFLKPEDDGGSPITSYEARQSHPDAAWHRFPAPTKPAPPGFEPMTVSIPHIDRDLRLQHVAARAINRAGKGPTYTFTIERDEKQEKSDG